MYKLLIYVGWKSPFGSWQSAVGSRQLVAIKDESRCLLLTFSFLLLTENWRLPTFYCL